MIEQRSAAFADRLNRFAAEVPDARVAVIAAQLAAPLRVAVCGRRGVGRRTVARALCYAGSVITAPSDAELTVYVLAEVAKPEDVTAVAALPRPMLAVLNKADLTGRGALAEVRTRLAVPTEPMAGLLALAVLAGRFDDRCWAALQRLAADPVDPGPVDLFLAGPHPLPRTVRRRLCDTLDMPAITDALAAIRAGGSVDQVVGRLRRLSGVDPVLHRLSVLGAGPRHRRLRDAVARLEALAVGDARVAGLLTDHRTVLARAALRLGCAVEPPEDP